MRHNGLMGLLPAVVLAGPAAAADFRPTLPPAGEPVADAPGPFYVHVGPGGVFLNEGAKLYANGARIGGASIKAKPQLTAVVEGGYFVTPNWAFSFTGGIPPWSRSPGPAASPASEP